MKLSLVRKMTQKELGKIDSFSKRKIKRKPYPESIHHKICDTPNSWSKSYTLSKAISPSIK